MKKRIIKTVRDEKPFLRIGASLLRELGFLETGTKLVIQVQHGKLVIIFDESIEEPLKKSENEISKIPVTDKKLQNDKKKDSDKKKNSESKKEVNKKVQADSIKLAKDIKESIHKLLKSAF